MTLTYDLSVTERQAIRAALAHFRVGSPVIRVAGSLMALAFIALFASRSGHGPIDLVEIAVGILLLFYIWWPSAVVNEAPWNNPRTSRIVMDFGPSEIRVSAIDEHASFIGEEPYAWVYFRERITTSKGMLLVFLPRRTLWIPANSMSSENAASYINSMIEQAIRSQERSTQKGVSGMLMKISRLMRKTGIRL